MDGQSALSSFDDEGLLAGSERMTLNLRAWLRIGRPVGQAYQNPSTSSLMNRLELGLADLHLHWQTSIRFCSTTHPCIRYSTAERTHTALTFILFPVLSARRSATPCC